MSVTASISLKPRYGMLRMYRVILLIAGWVIIVLGLVAFLAIVASVFLNLDFDTPFSGLGAALVVAGALGSLALAGLVALGFLGTADLILLLIDIEDNTRTATEEISDLSRWLFVRIAQK